MSRSMSETGTSRNWAKSSKPSFCPSSFLALFPYSCRTFSVFLGFSLGRQEEETLCECKQIFKNPSTKKEKKKKNQIKEVQWAESGCDNLLRAGQWRLHEQFHSFDKFLFLFRLNSSKSRVPLQWRYLRQRRHNPLLLSHPYTWAAVFVVYTTMPRVQVPEIGSWSLRSLVSIKQPLPNLTLLARPWFTLMGARHGSLWVTHPSLLTSLAYSSRQVSTGSLSWPSAMASWQSSNE